MAKHNQTVGKMGENLAKRFLEDKGLRFVDSNYRTPHGEIDLIFIDGQQSVFVEVKTRTNSKFGHGESAVNRKKIEALIFASETYLEKNALACDNWRIDVVVIEKQPGSGDFEVLHFENVGLEEDLD
ncbi:MAG: YraN family protein [Anaerolineaceae bacterium]